MDLSRLRSVHEQKLEWKVYSVCPSGSDFEDDSFPLTLRVNWNALPRAWWCWMRYKMFVLRNKRFHMKMYVDTNTTDITAYALFYNIHPTLILICVWYVTFFLSYFHFVSENPYIFSVDALYYKGRRFRWIILLLTTWKVIFVPAQNKGERF